MPTGIGYDIHRLVPTAETSSIPVGGVSIPCSFKIEAHSDGDVLLHALVDACLGSLSLGDIGQWFPDSDKVNFNRPSNEFVAEVLKKITNLGQRITHIDSNVFLEHPKLAPHKKAIRKQIAELLGLDLCHVSVKAKTMEGLGPVGESKAIAAQVLVTIEEKLS